MLSPGNGGQLNWKWVKVCFGALLFSQNMDTKQFGSGGDQTLSGVANKESSGWHGVTWAEEVQNMLRIEVEWAKALTSLLTDEIEELGGAENGEGPRSLQ